MMRHNWQNIDQMALSSSRRSGIMYYCLGPPAFARLTVQLRLLLNEALFAHLLEQVPDGWLLPEPGIPTPEEKRRAYVAYLSRRLSAASLFVEEASSACAKLV